MKWMSKYVLNFLWYFSDEMTQDKSGARYVEGIVLSLGFPIGFLSQGRVASSVGNFDRLLAFVPKVFGLGV